MCNCRDILSLSEVRSAQHERGDVPVWGADMSEANTAATLPLNADGGAQMHTWVIGPDGVMRRQWWRQVGWHGQTGRVYALTDNPRNTEPGGWYPLWHLIENEAPPAPEAPDGT